MRNSQFLQKIVVKCENKSQYFTRINLWNYEYQSLYFTRKMLYFYTKK